MAYDMVSTFEITVWPNVFTSLLQQSRSITGFEKVMLSVKEIEGNKRSKNVK